MFDGENDMMDAVIGYGVLSAAEQTRRSADIQLAQLNLLRAHQGLPPIEYVDNGPNLAMRLVTWAFVLTFVIMGFMMVLGTAWSGPYVAACGAYVVWRCVRWYRRGY